MVEQQADPTATEQKLRSFVEDVLDEGRVSREYQLIVLRREESQGFEYFGFVDAWRDDGDRVPALAEKLERLIGDETADPHTHPEADDDERDPACPVGRGGTG